MYEFLVGKVNAIVNTHTILNDYSVRLEEERMRR